MKSRCLGRCVLKLGSSKYKNGSTFQNAQNTHKGLVAHQLIEQLLVACVEDDLDNLKHRLQLVQLLVVLNLSEDSQQTRQEIAFREEDGCDSFVALCFGNVFEFCEDLMQVVGLGIWHFVFKIEVNSLSGRN